LVKLGAFHCYKERTELKKKEKGIRKEKEREIERRTVVRISKAQPSR
jgi:hypothetical protein